MHVVMYILYNIIVVLLLMCTVTHTVGIEIHCRPY